jgi:hypothetical protein
MEIESPRWHHQADSFASIGQEQRQRGRDSHARELGRKEWAPIPTRVQRGPSRKAAGFDLQRAGCHTDRSPAIHDYLYCVFPKGSTTASINHNLSKSGVEQVEDGNQGASRHFARRSVVFSIRSIVNSGLQFHWRSVRAWKPSPSPKPSFELQGTSGGFSFRQD